MPQISEDLRQRVVSWYYDHQKGAEEISELAGCSERTVYNILQLHREFGQVTNPYARPRGRPRTLDTNAMNYISSLMDANPVIYLDEIQDKLLEIHNIEVSTSTIYRALVRLAISHKQVAASAMEHNELLHATWIAANGDIPKEYIVWIDEAGVDDHTNQCDVGWVRVGQACVRRVAFIHGEQFSILPALTCDGIIALDIFEGSVNKDRFISYLRDQLVGFVI
jgi:transposase